MNKVKQVKSSEPEPNKKRFFERKFTNQEPVTDLEHLRRWSKRIKAYIDHVEGRLRKMENLPIVDQDAECDNILLNPHVTRLYRPSLDEMSALIHLGVRYPIALHEVKGYLRNADAFYDRLPEGVRAGDKLAGAILELHLAIEAAIKGIAKEDPTSLGLRKRSPGELENQVSALINSGVTSPTKIAKTLNETDKGRHKTMTRENVKSTAAYKKLRNL